MSNLVRAVGVPFYPCFLRPSKCIRLELEARLSLSNIFFGQNFFYILNFRNLVLWAPQKIRPAHTSPTSCASLCGLVKMDHTNMKEQENLRRTTVPDVLAFLFEVTFVPLERCDFYVLLGLLA